MKPLDKKDLPGIAGGATWDLPPVDDTLPAPMIYPEPQPTPIGVTDPPAAAD